MTIQTAVLIKLLLSRAEVKWASCNIFQLKIMRLHHRNQGISVYAKGETLGGIGNIPTISLIGFRLSKYDS